MLSEDAGCKEVPFNVWTWNMRAVRYAQEQRIKVNGKQGVLHADMELKDTNADADQFCNRSMVREVQSGNYPKLTSMAGPLQAASEKVVLAWNYLRVANKICDFLVHEKVPG